MQDSTELQFYVKQANKHKLLTREQEDKLARRFKEKGDRAALNILVERNLRFVLKVANEYRTYNFPLADLVQEGNLGLIRSIEKFNPDKGFRLITYSVWWIRAYIQNYIMHNWSLVKMGTTQAQRTLFYKLRQTRQDLEYKYNREVTLEEVAETLSQDIDVVRDVDARMRVKDYSLDTPLPGRDGDNGRATHLDMVEDESPATPELLERQEKIDRVRRAVAKLIETCNAKEKDIIRRRLLAEEPQTLQSIGTSHGVSRERVRQIEEKVIKQLKEMLAA